MKATLFTLMRTPRRIDSVTLAAMIGLSALLALLLVA